MDKFQVIDIRCTPSIARCAQWRYLSTIGFKNRHFCAQWVEIKAIEPSAGSVVNNEPLDTFSKDQKGTDKKEKVF